MPPLQETHTDTEGLAYTKPLHTAGFVRSFHTLPPLQPSPDTTVAKLRVQKANSPVLQRNLFYVPAKNA